MFGMKALHQVKIIHTDLKPDNIILIPDATIGMGYKLRIIDLDWAIFSDRQAPWHGKQGYIGTPNYLSPEHLTPGKIPLLASDVFTCGIMLSEVLGDGHPFASAGDDYDAAAAAGRFKPIKLRQAIAKVDDQGFLESILNDCLNPDPAKRPTAAQVCDALMGKTFAWHSSPEVRIPPPPTPRREEPVPRPAPSPKGGSKSVEITFEGQKVTLVSVDGEFGKQTFKSIHPDAQFLSNPQFKLRKQASQWMIEHCASATNETIVDGHKLMGAEPVRDGMRIAVGNSAKGVEKLPLILKLVN
jgi:serine/threonine protein kinase